MSDTAVRVTFANFARIESARMFAAIAESAGGSNRWNHFRVPTPIDRQTVIRMNRDTLYSAAIVDVSAGATITLPEAGDRYISVMLVNEDHYINRVIHDPGTHELSAEDLGSEFVLAAVRVLVDPENPADVASVNALQDRISLTSAGGREFAAAEYDEASLTETRDALLTLAKGLGGFSRCFGAADAVDPIRHLLATAAGWGGLPEHEAFYVNVDPRLPVGQYTLRVADVPVDGFWSVSLYDEDGFFAENDAGAYSVNSVTGIRDPDGAITIRFGGDPELPNALPIADGWNYLIRLYRPRPEVLDGTWTFPMIETH